MSKPLITLFLKKFLDGNKKGRLTACHPEEIKCYKQACIALAIKKVRFCQYAKDAVQKISTRTARISREFSGISARGAAFALYGQAICREEIILAISRASRLKCIPLPACAHRLEGLLLF